MVRVYNLSDTLSPDSYQQYPVAPMEKTMTTKISIQMMMAARSHIKITTINEVPAKPAACHH